MSILPPPGPEEGTPEPPVAASPPAPRRSWLRRAGRAFRLLALLGVAIVVALIVAALTIDLGPSLRARAEREGSRQIQRPMHIGRLSVQLLRGRFVLEDFVIEGLRPGDRPFLRAERLEIRMPWWTAFRREIFFESIVLSDWEMLVETFPDGRHNFIRIPTRRSAGPSRFVTTVQHVRAQRGQFTYEDHGTPWSTVARNLDITIAKLRDYRGEARFHGGTVQIQQFEPMWANMYTTFHIDGGKVVLDRIDLDTDGARSKVTGEVDLRRWPEQIYHVDSAVQFPRMRELFWAGQEFDLHGNGRFTGTFHLFKGGRELKGSFSSPEAGLNDFRFPDLKGNVLWVPDRLAVTDTSSRFYGGRLQIGFEMAPLGRKVAAVARLDAAYDGVDLATFTDFMELRGLRLAGRASGRTLLAWPLGRWSLHRGEGRLTAVPPPGTALMPPELPEDYAARYETPATDPETFDPVPFRERLPVGGTVVYRFGPEWIDVARSEVASPRTFVAFEGRTAYGRGSRLDFHVTSGDWQESDRVLAGIISAFGATTRAVPVGGFGTFDGTMTGDFRDPRIEGRFDGDRVSAWNVTWGAIEGDVAIEDAYVDVRDGRVTGEDDARLAIDGRFSIGFPRRDGGDAIDARIRATRWSVAELRHAFGLDDYDVTGKLSGEFHLYGRYQEPQGFGRLELADAVAYGEPFERATAGLRFEGRGVRLDAIDATKAGGTITGAAYVGWDGTYSFNATGRRVPVESIAAAAHPEMPLSGMLQFTASGSGSFANPRYEVEGRIDDLFVGDEGVGQVIGDITIRGDQLTIDRLEAASARLAVSGSGRIALAGNADADLVLQVSDTSIDPYVRSMYANLSPYTTAVVSGTLRLTGELRNPEALRAEVAIQQADLRLFDYRMRNDGVARFVVDQQRVRVDRLRLVGEGTAFEMFGDVDLGARRIALRGLGDANLGLLQGFLRDIRSSGAAELQVDIRGPLSQPVVLGAATLVDGRVRHFTLPHALEALNGRVEFDASGIRLDGLQGRFGGGPVVFGGTIGFKGFTPEDYAITAQGENMRVRYPEGFRSVIDADLALRGNFWRPVLSGTVRVDSATWNGTVDTGGTGVFGLAGAGEGRPGAEPAESLIPVRFDIRVEAPSTLRIENRNARLVASADVTLRGNFDRPLLFGRVEIERGEVFFEGNRYQVTRGTVDFANPNRIEPFFDLEAETRARVPGETYRIVFHGSGTPERFAFDLTSDPPLSEIEIIALLFGDVRDPSDPELRQLRTPGRAEQEILAARAARILTNPISSEVGRVVEETFGVDTVQITPSLGDIWTQQLERLSPSARLTIGKRISERLYLTFSQAISTSSREQIILIEFNQSDRLSWVLSQNEDQTYAINARVRHVF